MPKILGYVFSASPHIANIFFPVSQQLGCLKFMCDNVVLNIIFNGLKGYLVKINMRLAKDNL